jgi:enoyl-[acyl-carrier protein] reductase II
MYILLFTLFINYNIPGRSAKMNTLCEHFQIRFPIFQGGMGNISNAPLTAAVSNAGALGTLGVGTMGLEEIEKKILETKEMTDEPFCVNIPLSVHPNLKEVIKLVVKHGVSSVSLSAGNPVPFIDHFHENGIKVICVVASVKHAKKAEKADADVIVAEGYEAAGINSTLETTTLTLIPQIVDAVNIPVVAAGGIADGRGLAAVLSLGASGAQMGTRFIATKEAPFHESYKQKILAATDVDTVIVGRSVDHIRRLIKTPYASELLNLEREGISSENFAEKTSEDYHLLGAIEGKSAKGFMNSGQIAGLIKDVPTVTKLIETIIADTKTAASSALGKL